MPPSASRLLRVFAAAGALALLPAALPAQYYTSFGKNKIQYREFDWKIYHSPHFDIYHYSAEAGLLEKVASLAESAYDRLARDFDHQIKDPIPLIFFATHSAFEQNNIILNFIPEGIGAFASPVRNRMVLPVDLADGELFQLVSHELTHIFQYDLIFRGKTGRGIGSQAPQWFMEGMASYMAKDESTSDKMFLRDAVVNDRIPSILERGVSGFLAYRFGHATFDFIEERWGKEGFRDLVYEFRNTFGGRADRAIERAFKIHPEDFDLDFRRWLRKKYLPQLVETGEPSDFGRPFRDEAGKIQEVLSPAASPSGDLVAALAVTRGDVDLVLYDTRTRRAIANLSKGYTDEYEYLVSQFITAKARMGRDLSFSPDGNYLAVFAKREKGRSLLVFDVLRRRLDRKIDMDIEQQHSPAWSPDGKTLAFSGNHGNDFDIFLYDLASGAITNLTDDDVYDGAPVFTPDGGSLVFSSTVGEDETHLYRIALDNPRERFQLTEGAWNDKDATFTSDGKEIVFTSDRTGVENIWALELATGKLSQLTNAVTGCFMPMAVKREKAPDQVVYTGFWKGSFDLYLADLDKPVTESAGTPPAATPTAAEALPKFEPDIQVTLDDANVSKYHGMKLFVEDAGASVGITTDQTVLGYTYLNLSDYLGNHRLFLNFSAIESFSNFDFTYVDFSRRWNWAVEAFDYREYYVTQRSPVDPLRSKQTYQTTGAVLSWIYPFTLYHRVEAGLGYVARKASLPIGFDELGQVTATVDYKDDYPYGLLAVTGDSVVYGQSEPVSGRRWRLRATQGGSITTNVDLDARQYFQLTERSSVAFRLFAGWAGGDNPTPYSIGGLDTIRGIDYRSMFGDRAFFANAEIRFPLIDVLSTPFLGFRGIRGRVFLDVGGAWYSIFGQDFKFWNSDENRLQDAVSSYGWGLTVDLGGIDLNWDFAKRWDFKDGFPGGFSTEFWIGTRF